MKRRRLRSPPSGPLRRGRLPRNLADARPAQADRLRDFLVAPSFVGCASNEVIPHRFRVLMALRGSFVRGLSGAQLLRSYLALDRHSASQST